MAKIKVKGDPGHAKKYNAGAIAGYYESVANWYVANYAKKFANKTGFFKMDLTKSSLDQDPSLTSRGQSSKGYDIFHSFHSNAYTKTSKGCMVFRSVDLPYDKENANIISSYISNALKVPNLGQRVNESKKYPGEDYYTVIDTAQDIGCKHVFLSESLFHSNPDECKIRMQTINQMKEAIAIIFAYIKIYGFKLDFDKKDIIYIQEKLKCTVDGILGPQTCSAIMYHEKKNEKTLTGLPNDWILDKKEDKKYWFKVQTGAFTDKTNAKRLVKKLKKSGFNAVIITEEIK